MRASRGADELIQDAIRARSRTGQRAAPSSLSCRCPSVDEILRINGTAEIRDDDELRERFAVDGKLPATVLVVAVGEAYLHCAKALMRSRLWDADAQVDRAVLPSMGQMLKDQIGHNEAPEDQEVMVARYRKILY